MAINPLVHMTFIINMIDMLRCGELTVDQIGDYLNSNNLPHHPDDIKFYADTYTEFVRVMADTTIAPDQKVQTLSQFCLAHPNNARWRNIPVSDTKH